MGRTGSFVALCLVSVLLYVTRASWAGCVGLPYTMKFWLNESKPVQCSDVVLTFARPDRLGARCGDIAESTAIRAGEGTRLCGLDLVLESIDRSYPEERLELVVRISHP